MQAIIATTIVVLGVVTLVASLRSFLQQSGRHTATSVVIVLVILGLSVYETGLLGRGIEIQLAFLAASGSVSIAALIANRGRWRERISATLLLPAVLPGWLFISNAIHNPSLGGVETLARLAPVVFWIALGFLLSTGRPRIEVVASTVSIALGVASILSAVGSPWRACDQFKCGVFDGIFTGPFASENYLAKVAAAAAILCIFGLRGWARVMTLALSSLVLLASTSRTAIVATLAAILIGLVAQRMSAAGRRFMATLICLAYAITNYVIVSTAAPDAYSNRGHIWRKALEAVGPETAFGVGIARWAQLQAIGVVPPRNFPHNELVLLIFAGGFVAAALYLVVLLRLAWAAAPQRTSGGVTIALLCFAALNGLTEVVWNPSTIDGNTFVIAALVCAASSAHAVIHSDPKSGRARAMRARAKTNRQHRAALTASPSRTEPA